MTITSTPPSVEDSVGATPTTGPFSVPFEFFGNGDLVVKVDGATQTLTTDYTVTGGDGSTGSITFVSAISSVTLTITGAVPYSRSSDFPTSGPFSITSLNTELDRVVAMIKQVDKDLDDVVAGEFDIDIEEIEEQLFLDKHWTDPREYGVVLGTSETPATANLAAWNLMVADLNAGTIKSVELPEGDIVLGGTPDTITASDWTIRSQGATTIRMASTAGTDGTFFDIGDDSNTPSGWLLADLKLLNSNSGTLDGTENAIVCNASADGRVVNVKAESCNGYITLGSTTLGTSCARTQVLLGRCSAAAGAGGKTVDIQASSDHSFALCDFGAAGTATSAFRGMLIHPGASDTVDGGEFVACNWKYASAAPDHVIEMDATDHDILSQRFIGGAANGGSASCVHAHIDSGATTTIGFDSIVFHGFTANGSGAGSTLICDNTGDRAFDLSWNGGALSTVGGHVAEVIGAQRVNLTIDAAKLMNRSTSVNDTAVLIADDAVGVAVTGNTVQVRESVAGGGSSLFLGFTHLVEFAGDATNCVITGNDASLCTTDLLSTTSDLTSANIVDNNLYPSTGITATADGLTTGLIPPYFPFCRVTSASADNICTLPAAVQGMVITGWVAANGFELRTPSGSGTTINSVDSDGTNEAAIPATTYFEVTAVSSASWILHCRDQLGAVVTAIVPDAA